MEDLEAHPPKNQPLIDRQQKAPQTSDDMKPSQNFSLNENESVENSQRQTAKLVEMTGGEKSGEEICEEADVLEKIDSGIESGFNK